MGPEAAQTKSSLINKARPRPSADAYGAGAPLRRLSSGSGGAFSRRVIPDRNASEIPCIFPAAAGREFLCKLLNHITESGSAAQLRGKIRKIPCKFPAGRELFAKTEPADGPVRDPSRRCRQHGLSRESLHGRWGCKARKNRPKVWHYSIQYQWLRSVAEGANLAPNSLSCQRPPLRA